MSGHGGPSQRAEMVSLLRECRCTHVVLASRPGTDESIALLKSTPVRGDWPGWVVVEVESADFEVLELNP